MKQKKGTENIGTPGNKFGFKSLDDVFNYSKKLTYKTKDKDVYEKEIRRMNVADLQSHAISLGIKPSRNRSMLEKNLIALFRKNSGDKFGIRESNQRVKNPAQVLEIMSKGA